MKTPYNLPLPPLPDGYQPISGVVLVKCLTDEGKMKYVELRTDDLHPVEALGMVETARDSLKTTIMRSARFRRTRKDEG